MSSGGVLERSMSLRSTRCVLYAEVLVASLTPCLFSLNVDAYVFSLPTGFHYRPPSAAIATPCQCSTVFYSVLAACADCQSREVLP